MNNARRATALLVAFMLTACTSDATEPAASASTPARVGHAVGDLTATVVQYTRDRPAHVVQVKITNTSTDTLDVTLVRPRFAGFPVADPPAQTSHLVPADRRDFPVALGQPACTGPAEGASEVVVRGTTADGVAVEQRVPIVDEHGLLARVHELDCGVMRVEEAADITISDRWRRVGEGADAAVVGHVTMALRPGGGTVQVTDLDAGLLLLVVSGTPERDAGDADYMVDADQPRTEWDVELVGARCDGHAVAESRRLIALTFLVSVDGAEPVAVRRSPDVAGYRTIVAALTERCEHRQGGIS